jgi:uncharacterized protein (DUF1810 family)
VVEDPHRLGRFVQAQRPIIGQVLAELRRGRKESHWMWFVFPQIAGLGRSATAREFAVASLDEAEAYLAHPILGPRLRQCVELVLNTAGRTAEEIFGPIDSIKFRSSMTLFDQAAPDEAVFGRAIEKYFSGERDGMTLEQLGGPRARAGESSTEVRE